MIRPYTRHGAGVILARWFGTRRDLICSMMRSHQMPVEHDSILVLNCPLPGIASLASKSSQRQDGTKA